MPKQIPCGEKFIVGDVVRWKEAVWVGKGKRKKTLIKVGERRVTVELLTTEPIKGLVRLSVCKREILANIAARMERRRRAGACDRQVSGLKKARLCRSALGENCACSAGFLLSFTGPLKQAPEHNMFFTTYDLYDIH